MLSIIIRSLAQYNLDFNFEGKIREKSQYEGGIVVSDDKLGSCQKTIGPFFMRPRIKVLVF